jgi:hypothetical protein
MLIETSKHFLEGGVEALVVQCALTATTATALCRLVLWDIISSFADLRRKIRKDIKESEGPKKK